VRITPIVAGLGEPPSPRVTSSRDQQGTITIFA
jgi:hypothetical protein